MNFLFNVNFWGKSYTDLFLNYSLPSQLAPENLPYMVKHNVGDMKYRIYTTREDEQAVRDSPAFKRLCELMATEILLLEDIDSHEKHDRGTMTQCHAHAIDYANKNDYSIIFIWPDTVFSNNTFTTLLKLAQSGKKNVFIGALIAQTTPFLEEFDRTFTSDGGHFSVPPRKLVALCSKHLSGQILNWFWDSPTFYSWPQSFIFWRVPGEGILERAVHLTPFLLTPDNKDAKLTYNPHDERAIDSHDYLGQAIKDFVSVHVVNDSDDVCIIGLNNLDHILPPEKSSITSLAIFGKDFLYPYNVYQFRHKIRFHSSDLNPQWEQVESFSEEIAQRFYATLELFDRYPDIYHELKKIRQDCLKANEKDRLQQQQLLDAAGGLYHAGKELFDVKLFDKAATALYKVLEIVPGHLQTHLDLARTHAAMNDYSKAFKLLLHVLQVNPGNPDALAIADSLINKNG